MSKIANYLNEHILGDVTVSQIKRLEHSHDNGILNVAPEIIVRPQTVNDIRKIARFSYQLSKKGFGIDVTAKGSGTTTNGSSLSDGIIVDMTAYMNKIPEFDGKQNLVRVQAGATIGELNSALKLQGRFFPNEPILSHKYTLGGILSSGVYGPTVNPIDDIYPYIDTLEVVLSNGDVIQTSRISKRELNKKKGLQTLEGTLYRDIDNLISDNQELIDSEQFDEASFGGYSNISRVKEKDGSFDLTPLMIGSEGSLGIISEMILKTDFYNTDTKTVVLGYENMNDFRDIFEEIEDLNPSVLIAVDDKAIETVVDKGFKLQFMDEKENLDKYNGLIYCVFDSFSERNRKRKIKKVIKLATKKYPATKIFEANSEKESEDIKSFESLVYQLDQATKLGSTISDLFKGVYIKPDKFDEFKSSLDAFVKKTGIFMPYTRYKFDTYDFFPEILTKTSRNKQELLQIFNGFYEIVKKHDGIPFKNASEGRVGIVIARKNESEEILSMYDDIKKIFDSENIMNRDVKQDVDLKELVSHFKRA